MAGYSSGRASRMITRWTLSARAGDFDSGGLGGALEVLADLVSELVDLVLGLIERGLGPRGPLGGAGLPQGRLPGCPVTALGPSKPGHDRTTPSEHAAGAAMPPRLPGGGEFMRLGYALL